MFPSHLKLIDKTEPLHVSPHPLKNITRKKNSLQRFCLSFPEVLVTELKVLQLGNRGSTFGLLSATRLCDLGQTASVTQTI